MMVALSEVLQTKREAMTCQKSDYLIVAMNPVKVEGVKGVISQRFPMGNTCSTGGYQDVGKELKEISYQS